MGNQVIFLIDCLTQKERPEASFLETASESDWLVSHVLYSGSGHLKKLLSQRGSRWDFSDLCLGHGVPRKGNKTNDHIKTKLPDYHMWLLLF
jgi:hypothetical protein